MIVFRVKWRTLAPVVWPPNLLAGDRMQTGWFYDFYWESIYTTEDGLHTHEDNASTQQHLDTLITRAEQVMEKHLHPGWRGEILVFRERSEAKDLLVRKKIIFYGEVAELKMENEKMELVRGEDMLLLGKDSSGLLREIGMIDSPVEIVVDGHCITMRLGWCKGKGFFLLDAKVAHVESGAAAPAAGV